MQSTKRLTVQLMVVVLLIASGLLLTACSDKEAGASEKAVPAVVEAMENSEFNLVTLTQKASERLDVQTTPAREEQVDGKRRIVIPYASVLYGLYGETWAYISPAPLTFTRTAITVDYIDGDMAILTDGPPAGTEVASVGVAELYGIDTGVGK